MSRGVDHQERAVSVGRVGVFPVVVQAKMFIFARFCVIYTHFIDTPICQDAIVLKLYRAYRQRECNGPYRCEAGFRRGCVFWWVQDVHVLVFASAVVSPAAVTGSGRGAGRD